MINNTIAKFSKTTECIEEKKLICKFNLKTYVLCIFKGFFKNNKS